MSTELIIGAVIGLIAYILGINYKNKRLEQDKANLQTSNELKEATTKYEEKKNEATNSEDAYKRARDEFLSKPTDGSDK